ncbi:hypothetical protein RI367_003631 [Sorochytrium milnesiophthora]
MSAAAAADKFLPTVAHCEEAEQPEEAEAPAVVDPQEVLNESCAATPACAKLKEAYESCNARVEAGQGAEHETCVEEFFHFKKCLDHCTLAAYVSLYVLEEVVDSTANSSN